MNKISKPMFDWDKETGTACCILYDKLRNKSFVGLAQCHPEDEDMMSEKTGCNLAFLRAQLKVLQDYKNNELIPGLNALNQLYYSIDRSKYFDKNHYEVKVLLNQIDLKKADIETTKEAINNIRKEIKTMIDEKEDFYQKIRKNRKAGVNID